MFEFLVSQPFDYKGVHYEKSDVIVGDLYDEINADPHYSSGNYVIRRLAEPVPVKSSAPSPSISVVPPTS